MTDQALLYTKWCNTAKLWLVLDLKAAHPRSLTDVTRLAIAGGVDAVLCRIKDQKFEVVRSEATAVRSVCRELNTPFIMSHYPELAKELDADGIQIGISDPDVHEIRKIVGDAMLVGYSTHSIKEAKQCFESGVDYVFLGPIFPTPEKLKYGDPIGTDTVSMAGVLSGTVVFIGGINHSNIDSIRSLGAERVAVISAIQRSADPTSSSAELKRSLSS